MQNPRKQQQKENFKKGNLFKLHDGNQQIFDDLFQVLADI